MSQVSRWHYRMETWRWQINTSHFDEDSMRHAVDHFLEVQKAWKRSPRQNLLKEIEA